MPTEQELFRAFRLQVRTQALSCEIPFCQRKANDICQTCWRAVGARHASARFENGREIVTCPGCRPRATGPG